MSFTVKQVTTPASLAAITAKPVIGRHFGSWSNFLQHELWEQSTQPRSSTWLEFYLSITAERHPADGVFKHLYLSSRYAVDLWEFIGIDLFPVDICVLIRCTNATALNARFLQSDGLTLSLTQSHPCTTHTVVSVSLMICQNLDEQWFIH